MYADDDEVEEHLDALLEDEDNQNGLAKIGLTITSFFADYDIEARETIMARRFEGPQSIKTKELRKANILTPWSKIIDMSYKISEVSPQDLPSWRTFEHQKDIPVWIMPANGTTLLPTDFGRGVAVGYKEPANMATRIYVVKKLPLFKVALDGTIFNDDFHPLERKSVYNQRHWAVEKALVQERTYQLYAWDTMSGVLVFLNANGDQVHHHKDEISNWSKQDPDAQLKIQAINDAAYDYPSGLISALKSKVIRSPYLQNLLEGTQDTTETTDTTAASVVAPPLQQQQQMPANTYYTQPQGGSY